MNISNATPTRLATDLFKLKMTWLLWYLAVIALIHGTAHFLPDTFIGQSIPESFIPYPTEAYMVLLAIVACLDYLPYSIKNGITRKDYFRSSTIAAVGVSLFIALVYLATSFIFTPFSAYSSELVNAQVPNTSSILLSALGHFLVQMAHYMGGWIGAVGFYRYQLPGKVGFIAVALVFLALLSGIWEYEFKLPLTAGSLQLSAMPIVLSIGLTLILIALGLVLVRFTTKQIPIKVS